MKYIDTNGTITTQDSGGTIRVSPHASSDPLSGSFIDSHDGKRRKYIDRVLHVWNNEQWIRDEVTRATDASDGNPPQGAAIRRNYLDAIEQMRLKQREPAPEPARVSPESAPTEDALTPKQRYLRDLARQSNYRG